jgi:tetratricopeptide (TPR) repeat protein
MQDSFSKRLLTACVGAIAVSWAPPCLAEDAVPQAPSPEARVRFERGVKAFEQGRYRQAIELFVEANRLSPSARSSFNIAKAYERMRDERRALAAYRDYLRALPSAENGADVRRRIAELERALQLQAVQQLTVLSNPSGAAVLIDDVPQGVTPWTGELNPGRHRLSLRLTAYREVQQEFELAPQRALDVRVQLEAETASASAGSATGRVTADSAVASGTAVWPEPVAPWDTREPGPTERAPVSSSPPLVPPAQAPGAPSAEFTRGPGLLTWTLFGASAAALATAGGFEVSRQNMETRADSPIQIVHEDKYAAMQRRQTAARVFLGAGIATAVAGGIALYFDLDVPSAEPSAVEVACIGGECGLVVEGRF